MKSSKLNKIVESPLDDSDIRHYLPNAKIMVYSDLDKYKSIEELLPNSIDFCILLVEDSPSNGHWICVLRYNNIIEYFDSYGNYPDKNLTWISCQERKKLGQSNPLLSLLFDKCDSKIIYNPFDYQKETPDVKTCGRFCCMRILCLKEYGLDLKTFHKLMKDIKKKEKLNYDQIVSKYIDIL